MSLSEPRNTKDRAGKTVEVCDIAINPKFLAKIQNSQLFNNFFMQIVAEALSEKYNIQISMDKTIILHNRKFIGTLVSHRVRNDDVKRATPGVEQSGEKVTSKLLGNTTGEQTKPLVQEIDEQELLALKNKSIEVKDNWSAKIKADISLAKSQEPVYKLRVRVRDELVDEIHVELYLPKCVSSAELNLDVGEDRICVESMKHGYIFDKFVNYSLSQDRAQAIFDKTSKMLQIRIPVHN